VDKETWKDKIPLDAKWTNILSQKYADITKNMRETQQSKAAIRGEEIELAYPDWTLLARNLVIHRFLEDEQEEYDVQEDVIVVLRSKN